MTTATTFSSITTTTGEKQASIRSPKEGGGGGGGKPRRGPQSLVISPNLDALLEYDEKVRGSQAGSPTSPQPQSAPPTGLPPPPRRNWRKPQSPTTPKVGSPLFQESAEWRRDDDNPYINPPPALEAMLLRGDEDCTKIGIQEPVDGERGCSVPGVQDLQSRKTSQPSQISRVDKLISIGKIPFALFNDPPRITQFGDVSNTQQQRERSQAKGKLLKPKEPVQDSNEMPQSKPDDLVLDISMDSYRRRPLLSHVRSSSVASSSSSSSNSSATTHEPTSTIDPRISISSTMYPSSTIYSHGYVDEPVPILPTNRSPSLYSDLNTRQSFIDINTPDVAEFPLSDHDTRPPPPVKPRSACSLPPTTNFLDLDERSDLIRKNRKLARVFGQPPGPDVFPKTRKSPPVLPYITGHHRSAFSISSIDAALSQPGVWQPADTRRYSAPLSPDDFSFLNVKTSVSSHSETDIPRPSSPTSFMDLSDDLGSPTSRGRPRRPSSPSAQSLFESMSPEEQAEEIRKRKREKLAKLHRFLGSRVPANLVLGPDVIDPALPPLGPTIMSTDTETARKDWLRRRRSSSAAAYGSGWSDDMDRMKEDLNSMEKAINVRRALKMEKVFGVAPPQTLYHTRRSPSPSVTNAAVITGHRMISGWTSPGESLPPVTGLRNPNRSSYSKPKKNKDNRPGTSESSKALLPKNRNDSKEPDLRKRASVVYSHYQESLNSLNDIIDRDDKESLAELHEYLNSGDMSVPPPLQTFTRSPTTPVASDRRLSNASSIKSERRRSLPARTSIISVESEHNVSTPRPEVTDFQARRRRAAKLTQFFGVNYRELITDVLESIESGLEHERKRGTLDPEEVEDLRARLRNLRTKRTGI